MEVEVSFVTKATVAMDFMFRHNASIWISLHFHYKHELQILIRVVWSCIAGLDCVGKILSKKHIVMCSTLINIDFVLNFVAWDEGHDFIHIIGYFYNNDHKRNLLFNILFSSLEQNMFHSLFCNFFPCRNNIYLLLRILYLTNDKVTRLKNS